MEQPVELAPVFYLSHGETDPILADTGIFWWTAAYLGIENPAEIKNPLVSRLLGDLRGFPPLLVQATPPELLFEDARRFVERVKAAGGDATPGDMGWHGPRLATFLFRRVSRIPEGH